jgi:hypothetical protein
MIVILCEEPSMKTTLEKLLEKFFPHKIQGYDWQVLKFQGKNDLQRNIIPTMQKWDYNQPTFLILRDADGANCCQLKQDLSLLANESKKPYKIRIVCQQLESWFMGDLDAISLAYPRIQIEKNKQKFRNPDRLNNASEELSKITSDYTKLARAQKIAPHLAPEKNVSHSFQVFYKTISELITP